MPASAARIGANRQNSLKSTGPRTTDGKGRSRQNALKHGLTGEGVVLADEDAAEVERRLPAFQDEPAFRGDGGARPRLDPPDNFASFNESRFP